ncbi:Rz-like spanin [Pseudomonas phage Psxphi15]
MVACKPERVTEDTVRALAHGYVTNTYEVWRCNNRIQSYKDWLEQQEKLYGNGNK